MNDTIFVGFIDEYDRPIYVNLKLINYFYTDDNGYTCLVFDRCIVRIKEDATEIADVLNGRAPSAYASESSEYMETLEEEEENE